MLPTPSPQSTRNARFDFQIIWLSPRTVVLHGFGVLGGKGICPGNSAITNGCQLLPDDDLPGFCARLDSLPAAVYCLIDMACARIYLMEIVAIETKLARHSRRIELEAGIRWQLDANVTRLRIHFPVVVHNCFDVNISPVG